MARYAIVSTSGLHYRDCQSVWEAFSLVRGYPARFVVRREIYVDGTSYFHCFDRNGDVLKSFMNGAHS